MLVELVRRRLVDARPGTALDTHPVDYLLHGAPELDARLDAAVFTGSYGRRNTFLYGLIPAREAFNDPRLRKAWRDPLGFSAYAPAEPNPVHYARTTRRL